MLFPTSSGATSFTRLARKAPFIYNLMKYEILSLTRYLVKIQGHFLPLSTVNIFT